MDLALRKETSSETAHIVQGVQNISNKTSPLIGLRHKLGIRLF
jgi:hypothetical protein